MIDNPIILLRCHKCGNHMGTAEMYDISTFSQDLIRLLSSPKVHLLCEKCQECQHCFEELIDEEKGS